MQYLLTLLSQRRLAAKILTLIVIVLGLLALKHLPLAEKPRFDMGEGVIRTVYPGASASDVESNVTSKLEKELLSVSGIKEFHSVSEAGVSEIEFRLNGGLADPDAVYQDVRDAINRVSDLPTGVTDAPQLVVEKSYSLDFMVVGISSDLPYEQLRNRAKSVELALRRVEGIGQVYPIDLREPEFLIALEPAQLKRYGLTIDEIAQFIAERNVLISGGRLELLQDNPELITLAELNSLDKLGEMFISFQPNIRLRDVAGDITDTFEKAEAYGSMNGKRSILFDLRTDQQADVLQTSSDVKAVLADLGRQFGDDYQLGVGFDLANEIQAKADIVRNNGLVGLGLVLIVLALFLEKRIAFWVAVSIPVCLLGTMALLPSLGQILDAFTLSALILIIGIIVDDAVVVSDKIMALVEEGQSVPDAVKNGIKAVFPAISASILSTMIAFIPLMFLPGDAGQVMYVIPLTVIVALCFSFVDAMFFIPAHMQGVLSKTKNTRGVVSSRDRFKPIYQIVQWAQTKRKWVLSGAAALCIGLGVYSYNQLSYLFFPTDGAYLIEVSAETDPELSLDQVWQRTQQLEALIENTPEVASWYGEVGTPNSYWIISLTPVNSRERNAEDLVEEWEAAGEEIPGLAQVEFDIDAGGPPAGRPVDIKVVGGTDEGRNAMADDLAAFLETVPGTKRVNRDLHDRQPRVEAILQYQWLNFYGISAQQVGNIIKYAVEGERISRIFNGEEEVFFRVSLENDDKTLFELDNLMVRAADGSLVPMSKLIRWQETTTASQITHFNGERVIRVSSGVDPSVTDPLKVFDQVTAAFAGKDYQGARLVAAGQILETQQAEQGFSVALVLAIAGISILLLLLFDSWIEGLLVLLVVPFGVSGALFILYIHGQVLSFFSVIGMIALIGVMVNNSLVLIWHFRSTMDKLNPNNITAFIVEGTKSRVRPIILTTITTVVGLVPLAYGLGGYDNYMSPMALVVGWGCVISMLVTLLVIPSLYGYILQWKVRRQQQATMDLPPASVNS
ncbi:export membrane family protein [Photobacterium jeanii]|uniref:Export membrane family protein n=1 Tax=Photobacterium jeanii TaxID=858640 RepID=A0A178K322_9GAMM|nr:efflux RND transporter permease subunit [Photobacterium jeanii]OAN11123.1 export membrane family protein [Photobacterium jeanii]PST90639.1 AcrB/AcrD/AcrF family protein [Photobacterium jeanii]